MHDVAWLFDDRPFHGNLSAGIIISNQSLVLQRVTKKHRGRYQCVATNSEGVGKSEEVRLNVQCKYYESLSNVIIYLCVANANNTSKYVVYQHNLSQGQTMESEGTNLIQGLINIP